MCKNGVMRPLKKNGSYVPQKVSGVSGKNPPERLTKIRHDGLMCRGIADDFASQ